MTRLQKYIEIIRRSGWPDRIYTGGGDTVGRGLEIVDEQDGRLLLHVEGWYTSGRIFRRRSRAGRDVSYQELSYLAGPGAEVIRLPGHIKSVTAAVAAVEELKKGAES